MKSRVIETRDRLELRVPEPRGAFRVLLLLAALAGWAVGELAAARGLLAVAPGEPTRALRGFVLAVWSLAALPLVLALLRAVAGFERVVVEGGRITVGRRLLGVGGDRGYDLARVSPPRVEPPPHHLFDLLSGVRVWGAGGSVVAFEHGAETVRFGAGVDESEAHELARHLAARGVGAAAR